MWFVGALRVVLLWGYGLFLIVLQVVCAVLDICTLGRDEVCALSFGEFLIWVLFTSFRCLVYCRLDCLNGDWG